MNNRIWNFSFAISALAVFLSGCASDNTIDVRVEHFDSFLLIYTGPVDEGNCENVIKAENDEGNVIYYKPLDVLYNVPFNKELKGRLEILDIDHFCTDGLNHSNTPLSLSMKLVNILDWEEK